MFIPIGGVFVFGSGPSRTAGIMLAIFNIAMGGLALALGYVYGLLFLIIVGYVIAGLGLFSLLMNLIANRRINQHQEEF